MSKKVLVSLWEPLIVALKALTDGAFMKRDAYLDLVLRHEADMLDQEVQGQNSAEARAYISEHLALLRRKQVNLLLSEETVDRINRVCERKNTPRDAFINRVILLLVARPQFFEVVFFEFDWHVAMMDLLDDMPEERYVLITPSRLEAIGDIVRGDPFWYVRACIDVARESEGSESIPLLHQKVIPKDALRGRAESAIGFNCVIPSDEIEGHPDNNTRKEKADRLLDELFGAKLSLKIDESGKPKRTEREQQK